jgi:hypothetical protein
MTNFLIKHTALFFSQLSLMAIFFCYYGSKEKFKNKIQGVSYSFINILTSGRFRSQKALDNKILSHTSKIGKNYHIAFFTISKCHSSLNYST